MTTLYSIFRYTGTGTAQVLPVPPYIDKSNISVYVAGTIDTSWTWVTDSTISITAPAASVVVVQRRTSPGARLVDYQGSVPLTEADLDLDSTQAFYMGQEARDIFDDLVDLSGGPLTTAVDAAAAANASAIAAAAAAAVLEGTVVAATGVAVTDTAALQAAINALPAYGVLTLSGAFVVNQAIILKPRITLRGGSVTSTSGAVDCFRLVDDVMATGDTAPAGMVWTGDVPLDGSNRIVDAWPGEVHFVGVKMRGTLTPTFAAVTGLVNNESLGTFTLASHRAAVRIYSNGQNCSVEKCDIAFFDTGLLVGSSIQFRAVGNFITYCKFGTWATGNVADARFDNFVNTCFIGMALNYGGSAYESSTFTVHIDGIYEGCYVGVWAESAFALVSTSLYFEENRFRDIQAGGSIFGGDPQQIKSWVISSMFTKSPVNNSAGLYQVNNATGAVTGTLLTTATDYSHPGWSGSEAKGANIGTRGGNGLHIARLHFRGECPQGTRHTIFIDADTSNVDIGVSHQLPQTPRFLFANPNRVVLRTTGGVRYGPTSGSYFSHPIAFGDPSTLNWASGICDTGLGISETVKAYINWRYTDATARTSLNIAGSDAAAGSEVPVNVLGDFRVTNPAGTVPYLQINTGPLAWPGAAGNAYSLPNLKWTVQGTQIHDKRDPNNYATLLDASFFIQRLANHANDAAAAAGGIEINQLYRNGSVVMVRMV